MTEPKDRSAIVLPFGKHKGSTVAELLARDPAYAEWIVAQGWVAERFAELHAAILSRGAATDDSPEHNAIQVRFLDETFRVACILAVRPKMIHEARISLSGDLALDDIHKLSGAKATIADEKRDIARFKTWDDQPERANRLIEECQKKISAREARIPILLEKIEAIKATRHQLLTKVKFEQRGIDVMLYLGFREHTRFNEYDRRPDLTIEIKPTMGDDFPSVMRQMERLQCGTLVLGEYTGRAVSAPQLRQMFEANGKRLLFVRDIEAELANARAELE